MRQVPLVLPTPVPFRSTSCRSACHFEFDRAYWLIVLAGVAFSRQVTWRVAWPRGFNWRGTLVKVRALGAQHAQGCALITKTRGGVFGGRARTNFEPFVTCASSICLSHTTFFVKAARTLRLSWKNSTVVVQRMRARGLGFTSIGSDRASGYIVRRSVLRVQTAPVA